MTAGGEESAIEEAYLEVVRGAFAIYFRNSASQSHDQTEVAFRNALNLARDVRDRALKIVNGEAPSA